MDGRDEHGLGAFTTVVRSQSQIIIIITQKMVPEARKDKNLDSLRSATLASNSLAHTFTRRDLSIVPKPPVTPIFELLSSQMM